MTMFSLNKIRAALLEFRDIHGAETAVGHSCSNLLEMTEDFGRRVTAQLIANILLQKRHLNKLLKQGVKK